MNGPLRDQIASCRIEAAKFRRLATLNRKAARTARERRDWIEAMHASTRAGEYTLSARRCDERATELSKEAGTYKGPNAKERKEQTWRERKLAELAALRGGQDGI